MPPAAEVEPMSMPSRRRGTALTEAIYLSTLTELADTSFEELSFDKIAARAGAGKASLYRRWTTPAELVLEALRDSEIGFGTPPDPDSGSLDGDLTAALRYLVEVLKRPAGRALRPLLTQRPRHPELYAKVRELTVDPQLVVLLAILQHAADRGEVAQQVLTPRLAAIGPQLVIARHMELGVIDDDEIAAIVSSVLVPLYRSQDHLRHDPLRRE